MAFLLLKSHPLTFPFPSLCYRCLEQLHYSSYIHPLNDTPDPVLELGQRSGQIGPIVEFSSRHAVLNAVICSPFSNKDARTSYMISPRLYLLPDIFSDPESQFPFLCASLLSKAYLPLPPLNMLLRFNVLCDFNGGSMSYSHFLFLGPCTAYSKHSITILLKQ